MRGSLFRLLVVGSAALASVLAQGCATKTYGRQGMLTSYEAETLTCREMDLEIAKVRGFIDHVNRESEFSGRDVLALLGDLGIGNNLERTAALESATNRLGQLRQLRTTKKCETTQA